MAIDELRSLFVFDGLSDEQLRELDDASTVVSFDEGDVLFHEGEPSEFWWVLLGGRLELLRRSGHEVSVIAAMDRPPDAPLSRRPWPADTYDLVSADTFHIGGHVPYRRLVRHLSQRHPRAVRGHGRGRPHHHR